MRRLIVQHWISLDGHATDRNDKLDFFAPTVRRVYNDDCNKTILESVDCILFGRKTYEQFASVWPERATEFDFLAWKINTTHKIVFSNSIKTATWGKWKPATLEVGNPIEKIGALKSSIGKNIVIWGSLSLTQLAIQKGLVDEYHLRICPTITGGGRRFLPEGLNPTALKLIDSRRYDDGVVSLHYETR